MKTKHSNQIRIIGGSHKRSLVYFPDQQGLRPTPDRVRETLFNWLGQELIDQSILDLFAGSGALGFEAASRGAKNVYLVDIGRLAVEMLQQNQQRLKLKNINIVRCDALQFLRKNQIKFNICFLDPPFVFEQWPEILSVLERNLDNGAYIYIEAPKLPELPKCFCIHKNSQAGQSRQWLLQYRTDSSLALCNKSNYQ